MNNENNGGFSVNDHIVLRARYLEGRLKIKVLRPAVNGFVLAVVNLISILAAYGLYLILKGLFPWINQYIIQGIMAAVLTFLGFAAWCVLLRQLFRERFWIGGRREMMVVYISSLIWMPFIFVPLHYLGSGYLTSLSNILATWAFQALVNLLVLELISWMVPPIIH